MKKIMLASACILALSSAGALAGSSKSMGKHHAGTTGVASGMQDKRGDTRGSTPSGADPNTNNMSSQAGGGAGGAGGGK
jgi:hypothetical protein